MAFDRTDPADLLALKTEINTDPDGLGYAAVIENIVPLLALINAKSASYTVRKPYISSAEVKSVCTYSAYNTLVIDEQEWLQWMTSNSSVTPDIKTTTDLVARLTDGNNSIWSAAERDAMNAAMLALIDVDGSRAEFLFGFGTVISEADWIAARNS